MAKIEVPSPPDTPCQSCVRRKARRNPYERVQNIAGWAGMLAIPVVLLGIIAAYVLMIMWGIETGQYGSTEVTQTVNVPNNDWIDFVTLVGGLFGGVGILFAFLFWAEAIRDKWRAQAAKWEDNRRMED